MLLYPGADSGSNTAVVVVRTGSSLDESCAAAVGTESEAASMTAMENANDRATDTSADATWGTVDFGAARPSSLPPPPPSPVRWGVLDALLTLPVAFLVALIAAIPALIVFGTDNENALVALSSLGQFGSMIWWVWWVSKRKGRNSLALDFGLTATPTDLARGLGIALGMLIVGGVVGTVVAGLLDVDVDDAGNTQIIDDAASSAWFWMIALVVTTVGPIAEELVFRGLLLRSLERRFGGAVAVIGSAVVFALPHITDGTFEGQIVLWSQILVWGVLFAVAARHYGRLGPVVVAHMLVNIVGTAQAAFG